MPEESESVWFDEEDITDDEDNDSEYMSESDDQSENNDSDVQEVHLESNVDDDEVEIRTDNASPETPAATTTDNDDSLYRLLLKTNEIFSRIRSMVRFVRNNSVVRNYIQSEQSASKTSVGANQLVLDVRVRWNSSHRMLSRFLYNKEIIKSIIVSTGRIDGITKEQKAALKAFRFDDDDWELIESLKDILEPFVTATTILSTRNYSTTAVSMFICDKLEVFIRENVSDSLHLSKWKRSLRYQFHHYFNERVEDAQKHIMLVSYFSLHHRLVVRRMALIHAGVVESNRLAFHNLSEYLVNFYGNKRLETMESLEESESIFSRAESLRRRLS